jgi:uncharacterized membrane protein YdbT with pleckstrin-like domain
MGDPYLKSLLGNGEKVIYVTRQHWFVLMRNILVEGVSIIAIVALFTVLLNVVPEAQAPWKNWFALGYVFLIPVLVSLLIDFFQWFNRKFIITNWRVIQLSGVINKDVIDSSLEKVNDVKLTQSFFGRIFNFGTVEIMTASELGVNKFTTIGDPISFKTTIVNAKDTLDHDENGRPNASKAAPAALDVSSQLAHLQELREKGVLTDEEFQKIKTSLIAKL